MIARVLLNDDGPGVAHVRHEKVTTIGEDADTCGAAKTHVSAHIAHIMVGLCEAGRQSWAYLAERWVLEEIVIGQVQLQVALDKHGQAVFQEGAYFPAIRTMSVTDREEVAVFEAHDVRVGDVGILIHLVRIVCRYASFRGK